MPQNQKKFMEWLITDKRHRSSSSLGGVCLEGTRSERKLDIRASIPEVEDQFALAESRCDDLQEKIDLVKVLKKKRKLKKRSMTRVNEQPIITEHAHTPFISVRTQPKKKVTQQSARLRRLEVAPNPTRGYLDPATVEQHRMLGQVWGYGPTHKNVEQNSQYPADPQVYTRTRPRRTRADGDGGGMRGQGVQITSNLPTEVAYGQDNVSEYSDTEAYERAVDHKQKKVADQTAKAQPARKRIYSRANNMGEVPKWIDTNIGGGRVANRSPVANRARPEPKPQEQQEKVSSNAPEERPVVELFHKNTHPLPSPPLNLRLQRKDAERRNKKARELQKEQPLGENHFVNLASDDVIPSKKSVGHRHPRRAKHRSRGYELPTVASQMKQTDWRYHCSLSNRANIPFVVSKSTAPSHNIGVNIQQVLNGLKIQQPLSGIPLTIAHHMGLGHVPTYGTKSVTTQPSLDNHEINAIKLGQRLLMLPSYKCMSYNRLLSLYREGDGMVPRFLRAISRPHYFYTSMYNLATNREDLDGATSKGRSGNDRQHLLEFTGMCREYERVDKRLKEGHASPELERRRDELLRELSIREDLVKKLVQDSSTGNGEFNVASLRATASAAEDGYRHSSFKLNNMAD